MDLVLDLVKLFAGIALVIVYLYRMKLFIKKYMDDDWDLINYPTIVILLAILIPGLWRFILLIRSIVNHWKDR